MNPIIAFTDWVWGVPMLIWLVGGGLFLTIRLGFLQFTKLPFILKHTIGKSFGKKGEGDRFSGWQAVTGALASTLGAGNIVGTAMAIGYGGPGGVFWLWVTGLVACAVKYSEVTLAMKYRHINEKGEWEGGPQYYLSEATGWKWIGTAYAIGCIFCLFLSASAQIGSGVDNIVIFGLPRTATTVVVTIACGIVVIGGMRSLLSVTEKLVPVMSILYIIGALAVIILNIENLPGAFASIFQSAFTGRAAVGGFGGATLAACIRWGVARGIYSNDAGTGCTTISHSVADVNHPVQQGMWGVFEVFFDTLIVCSLTCLAILCTGVSMQDGIETSTMTATAFESTLGTTGTLLVAVCLFLFTFSTACAFVEFTCSQLVKLIGPAGRTYGRWALLAIIFVGGIVGIEALIRYCDLGSFLNVFFNMIGVYLCHSQVVKLTREYFSDTERWEHEKWETWSVMEAEYQKRNTK